MGVRQHGDCCVWCRSSEWAMAGSARCSRTFKRAADSGARWVRRGGPGTRAGAQAGEEGRACGRRGTTLAQLQKQRWAAPPRNRPDAVRSAKPEGLSLRGPRSRDGGWRRARAGPGQGYRRAPSPAGPTAPPRTHLLGDHCHTHRHLGRPGRPRHVTPGGSRGRPGPAPSVAQPAWPRPAALPEKQPLGFLPLTGTWQRSARLPWRQLLRR